MSFMSRKRALAVSLRLTVALATAGILSVSAAAETTKLRLVFPSSIETYTLPYLVAKKKGWFQEGGVEVEEVFVRGGSTAVRLLVGGSDDVSIVGLSAVFSAVLEGAKLKSIGSFQPLPDYKFVGAKSVKSMKELKGKTIAVAEPGDATAFLPMMVLRKQGIPTDDLKFVGVGGHSTRLLAVTSGRADATLLNSRTTIVGQQSGSINVLTNVSDELPLFGYVVLAVNENRLTDPVKRKALQAFLTASARGARFILQNPEEAADIMRERMPDVPREDLLSVIKDLNASKVWGVNGGSDPEIIRFSAKVSFEYGALRKEISASDIVDESLANEVVKVLGKAQ